MIRNVHERRLPASPAVHDLIDSLASPDDRLWPWELWPVMRFDRPLGVGAVGGHGPIHYAIDAYVPGQRIRFRFLGPAGFDGYHEWHVAPVGEQEVVLRHSLVMRTSGWARLTWPAAFRPMHDALIEDALHKAAAGSGQVERPPRWSPWVRLLRQAASRGRARSRSAERAAASR